MVKKLAHKVQRINLVTPVDLLQRIDRWMKEQPGFPPSRSEAIRHMIEQFLDGAARTKTTDKRKG